MLGEALLDFFDFVFILFPLVFFLLLVLLLGEHHVFQKSLFVVEFGEHFLQRFVGFFKFGVPFGFGFFGFRVLPRSIFPVGQLVLLQDFFDVFPEGFEMFVAAGDFFVDHHAVESFFGRFVHQLFGQENVFLADKPHAVNNASLFDFGAFDPRANFDFLLFAQ